jgi:dolichyl-phosphate beta-glucosyltransferase
MPFGHPSTYEVSIVIPVYNGSHLLEKHISPFLNWLKVQPFTVEVILVDDGSSDSAETLAFAQRHQIRGIALPSNKGKGAALKKGFEMATGEIHLFTDADIPFQYHNIETLISLLRTAPHRLIIGDRTDPRSDYFEKASFLRNLGSNTVAMLVNRFFVQNIKDTQCGLKGMGKEVSRRLLGESFIDRFAIDIELIYLAHQMQIPIQKMPVQVRFNDKSSVHVAKDGLKLLVDIYRIKKVHGPYRIKKAREQKNHENKKAPQTKKTS